MSIYILNAVPLTQASFAPFGDVIETEDSHSFMINDESTERFHDLAKVDVLEKGGRPIINIFRTDILPLPIKVLLMERHPLSSQAFIPMDCKPFLVLVAPIGETVAPEYLQLFISSGKQGVNYHRGVWHHPVLALEEQTDFIVVDRGGNGDNCDKIYFTEEHEIIISNTNFS